MDKIAHFVHNSRMLKIALPLLTVYADLVQTLQFGEEPTTSVYAHEVKERQYLYAIKREAQKRIKIYLGAADDPEVQKRAETIRASTERAKLRRKSIAALRTAGLPTLEPELGRVLEALASADLFRRGAVLVGTAAFQCYSPMVGSILPVGAMSTRDLDVATATLALTASETLVLREGEVPIPEKPETLETILKRADETFTGLPTMNSRVFSSRFRNSTGYVVEVLVPLRRRSDTNPMPIPGLQAGGIPLQHLAWLLENPVPSAALFGTGVFVTVPQPARYAVHKLLIAQKRMGDVSKRQKDLLQAQALIEALRTSDPSAIEDALEDARGRGAQGWAKPINASLGELGIAE